MKNADLIYLAESVAAEAQALSDYKRENAITAEVARDLSIAITNL